jgi:tetratricopeptide (TPR) repeat protein
VGYGDPNEFLGVQAGRVVSDFTKNSVGVGAPYTAPPQINVSVPYFGANRAAPPPPGVGQFVMQPNSGGAYVAATPSIVQSNDPRLGAQIGALNPQGDLPKPGELILPGPVDASGNQQAMYSASPLTGVRQMSPSDVTDLANLGRFTGMSQNNILDRLNLNANQLTKIQQELKADANPALASANGATSLDANAAGANQNPGLSRGPLQTLESPVNTAVGGAQTNAALQNGPLGGTLETQENYYNRVLGTPQQQSKQYDELKKRLETYEGQHPDATETSVQDFNRAMRDKEAQQSKPLTPAVPGSPGNAAGGSAKTSVKTPPTSFPPLSIQTFTQGVQGKGLKEMLGNAESLMKQGKYSSAIEVYGAAEAVAPNQPLIWVGRANAELGAAYYNRAAAHLKQAFSSDQALLMGQYDLRTFLGEDRLQSVIKDLKDIANSDPKSATPVFLLAYISYNTGNESRAAGWLDLAEKRSEGKDPIYKLLRDHWSLPPQNPTSSPSDEGGASTPGK